MNLQEKFMIYQKKLTICQEKFSDEVAMTNHIQSHVKLTNVDAVSWNTLYYKGNTWMLYHLTGYVAKNANSVNLKLKAV